MNDMNIENIEQKAKAYDEALEKAKKILDSYRSRDLNDVLFYVKEDMKELFPELKSNENEKIKESIKKVLANTDFKKLGIEYSFYDMVNWLESDKEKKNLKYVDSKFKVGDWITNGNSILHITNMDYGFYQFEDSYDAISIIDEKYRLWTIDDAKDGDVLAFKNNIGGIIICKSPTNYDTRSYCRLVNDNFISKEESGWDSKLLVPATKQQRDLLFAKMKEECYTWNDEKKTVKEIEQNVDNIIDESYQQQADDLIDMVTATNWTPTKEQLDAFKHFVRSIGESGYASQYDNNTKQLYSLLNDLENLVKRR
jgi:hypothetical protein